MHTSASCARESLARPPVCLTRYQLHCLPITYYVTFFQEQDTVGGQNVLRVLLGNVATFFKLCLLLSSKLDTPLFAPDAGIRRWR